MNDLNILDCSSIIEDILRGDLLPDYSYTIEGHERTLCYFNTDGIYPNWPIFMKTIHGAQSAKHKRFANAQEAFRKDIERAFGVLMSRWALLASPCRLWEKKDANKVLIAAIILHNMIVESRRAGYVSEFWSHSLSAVERRVIIDTNGTEIPFHWGSTSAAIDAQPPSLANFVALRNVRIMDEAQHCSLKQDLVEHIWKHSTSSRR